MDKFSENLPTEQSECEAQFTLKNQPLPNLKAVERVRTQSTFKNYPYDPSSFEQVRTQSTFNNYYPYHQFRTTLFSNYFEMNEYHVAQSTLKDYPPRIILTALLRFVEKKDPWFERTQYESLFT